MFQIGETYRRRDIHAQYGGQQQGGISTPDSQRAVFLFTGSTGEQYGYHDGWTPDSKTFLYTGEGQRGDMAFIRGNKAIRDHEIEGKELHLFSSIGKGFVKYEGQMRCKGHHQRTTRDVDGKPRLAIVFELERVN